MIVEKASLRDAAEIAALVNMAYRNPGQTRGWTDEGHLFTGARVRESDVADAFATGHFLVTRSTSDGPLVGTIHIASETGGGWYLSLLAVSPARQAQGVGRSLLEAAEQDARGQDVDTLRITVIDQRETLVGWYERRGFRRTGEVLPFPYDNPNVGMPNRSDLEMTVLVKDLAR